MNAIEIDDSLDGYIPLTNYRSLLPKMMNVIPAVYLDGLVTIYLRKGSTGNRAHRRERSRRRGRTITQSDVAGYYQMRGNGKQSTITLYVDRLDEGYRSVRWYPVIGSVARDITIGQTLFHEIGHHIHLTKHPHHAEKENVADDYAAFYLRRYFIRKRPVFTVFGVGFAYFVKAMRRMGGMRPRDKGRRPGRRKRIAALEAQAIAAYSDRRTPQSAKPTLD